MVFFQLRWASLYLFIARVNAIAVLMNCCAVNDFLLTRLKTVLLWFLQWDIDGFVGVVDFIHPGGAAIGSFFHIFSRTGI